MDFTHLNCLFPEDLAGYHGQGQDSGNLLTKQTSLKGNQEVMLRQVFSSRGTGLNSKGLATTSFILKILVLWDFKESLQMVWGRALLQSLLDTGSL